MIQFAKTIHQHITLSGVDSLTISLACFAGNITIFAFAYPFVKRAVGDLNRISYILRDRISQSRWIKWYSRILGVGIIANLMLIILGVYLNPLICLVLIISVISIIGHIFYVMKLYNIIGEATDNPFSKVKNIQEIIEFEGAENDITFVQDLVLYNIKTGESTRKIWDYFDYLIKISFHKWNMKLESDDIHTFYFGLEREEQRILFSSVNRVCYINRIAVDTKSLEYFYYIDGFFNNLLYYGIKMNNEKEQEWCLEIYPALKNTFKILANNSGKQHFVSQIRSDILEYYIASISYRIEQKVFQIDNINSVVHLLYYVIEYPIHSDYKNKFSVPFGIISSLIDYGYPDKFYTNFIGVIPTNGIKFHYAYNNIIEFHINVMAYMIFRKQYDLLNTYRLYEEPNESPMKHTLPQIPNTINWIFSVFLGNESVFRSTNTFAANTSATRYKFYVLFILLMDCKDRLDKYKKYLLKLKKTDFDYEQVKREIDYHSKFTRDLMGHFRWDGIMTGNSLDNYKNFLMDFSKDEELTMAIKYNKQYESYIKQQIDFINKKIKNTKQQILKTSILIIAEKELSKQTQKETREKKLYDLINGRLVNVLNHDIFQNFSYKGNERKILLSLCEREVERKQFLCGGYRHIEFDRDFFRKLFNTLADNCEEITSLSNISENDFSQYEIYSNISFKNDIENLIPNDKNFLFFSSSPISELTDIEVKGQKINVSKSNYIFHNLSGDRRYPICLMLINKSKLAIIKGELQAVILRDKGEQIEIIDNTPIYINMPKDEKIGYMVRMKIPSSDIDSGG